MTATSADVVALMERCRAGEERAWVELVEHFSGYVHAILSRGFGLSGHDAEDLFQEVFARLYERIDTIRDDRAVQGWIAQTTRRAAIDRHRAGGREMPVDEESLPDPGALDAHLERLDDALMVRDGLAALSEECNEVLSRFFLRDQSYRAISDGTGLAEGTIASRISRCLGKLREQVEGRTEPSVASGEVEGRK